MSDATKIEWADSTFNPWEGCTKVGPGCDHCYAENRNARYTGGTPINWGPGAPRRRTSPANWRKPLQWEREAAAFHAEHGRRRRVFCASLADVFDNAVDPVWRADLFRLIADTPSLDWLLLTKRIGNAHVMIDEALNTLAAAKKLMSMDPPPAWPWPNVWIGATIVNQAEVERDIPKLLETPAAMRFLSMEPLLGPVTLYREDFSTWCEDCQDFHSVRGDERRTQGIDWVIVGGESGTGARPMHVDWARSLRDQCDAASVPFLFKQWGEWTPGENVGRRHGTVDTASWGDGQWGIRPLNLANDDGRIEDEPDLYRVGKKAAGRQVDGVEHNGFPT